MKIFWTFLFIAAVFTTAISQSERIVFVEEFTQASCYPCQTTTPILNAMLDAQGDKIVQLRYQTPFPGIDPMNADNPQDVQDRMEYYSIFGAPEVYLDGIITNGAGVVTQEELNGAYANDALVALSVSHVLADDLSTITITASVTNEGTVSYDLADDKLRVAMMEEKISWSEPPGSTTLVDFEAVMKSFVTGTSGLEVPQI